MFLLARTLVYASTFVGFWLVFLPALVLRWAGDTPPASAGLAQWAGAALATAGALLAVACILTFVVAGRGTPAPFDPPRRFVAVGPYRVVRNPMYVGAGFLLAGVALYFGSLALLGYALAFLALTHAFVMLHEEPALRRTFGAEYDTYCARVGRWWPRRRAPSGGR